MSERNRLTEVNLDEASLAPASPNAEHERRIAIFDLKESNSFAVVGEDLAHRPSGACLDHLVAVEEATPEPIRDEPSHRRLPCSHHPHQHDVLVVAVHGARLGIMARAGRGPLHP